MSKFKIGQTLIYRKGSVKLSGRYVVVAVLPQPPVARVAFTCILSTLLTRAARTDA
jgi:hypothetical protein